MMSELGATALDFLPLLIDWIDDEGRILEVNAHEAKELSINPAEVRGLALERIYSSNSANLIRALASGGLQEDSSFPVWVNSPAYEEIPMVATTIRDPGRGLAVIKQLLTPATLGTAPELIERIEILSQMIGAATEACWCIDFLEPIDTSLAEDEIVDRIFSSQSRWRACNEAMARLYRVPDSLDFNTQPVSRYFPETEVNRQMARDLVRSNYRLDHAAAVDHRHDGTEMLVENDFRAAVKNGLLVRLWGTTRDIGPHRRREQQLYDRAASMLDILSAAPDPILVISEEGKVLAVNPAAESAWGRTGDRILGSSIDHFIEGRNIVLKLRHSALDGGTDGNGCDLVVLAADGTKDVWRFRAAGIEGDMRRYVLTARRKTRRKARLAIVEAAQ